MIHRTGPSWQADSWQQQLADAFTDPGQLLRYLEIEEAKLHPELFGKQRFSLRVTRWFASRMEKGNPNDPLLHQVLPRQVELADQAGFTLDPVLDLDQAPVPGLLHKYNGRALLITTGACGINCRYCFRRHYPYADSAAVRNNMPAILDYLRKTEDIDELILSGGDPLMLSDARLAELTNKLQLIPHLRRLRIHTRLPVVLPDRVTPVLVRWLSTLRLQPIVVLHTNHPRELARIHEFAFSALRENGITLLNQSVLLKGVNDNLQTLSDLSEKLFSMGVLPYYLHQLDRVKGAAHFEVTDAAALDLHRQMSARLSGYLVPKLVREIAGAAAKIPLQGA